MPRTSHAVLALLGLASCSRTAILGSVPLDAATPDVVTPATDVLHAPDAPDVDARLTVDAPDAPDALAPADAPDVFDPPPVGTRYVAHLSGAEVVPPEDTARTAEADLYLDRATGRLDVRLRGDEAGSLALLGAWAGQAGARLRALDDTAGRAAATLTADEVSAVEEGRAALTLSFTDATIRGQITRPSERVLASEVVVGGYSSLTNSYLLGLGPAAGFASALYDPEALSLRYRIACEASACGPLTFLAYDGASVQWLGAGSLQRGEVRVDRNLDAALARYRADARSGAAALYNASTSAVLAAPGTRLYFAATPSATSYQPPATGSVMIARAWRADVLTVRALTAGTTFDGRAALERIAPGEAPVTVIDLPVERDAQRTVPRWSAFDDDIADGRLFFMVQGRVTATSALNTARAAVLPAGQRVLSLTLTGAGVSPPVTTDGGAAFRLIVDGRQRTLRARGVVRGFTPREAVIALPTRTLRWELTDPTRDTTLTLTDAEVTTFGWSTARLVVTSAAHPDGEVASP